MPKMLEKSERIFNKVIDIQQFISNGFLLFIMSIITFDVLGRNLFNKPLKGTFELTELGAALLVFFALAITHRNGEHISIDFIVERFTDKIKYIINGSIEIVIAVILLIMSKHIYNNGLRMMEGKTTTTDLALSVHPFLFVITFTLIIFAITAMYKAIHYYRLAVNME